MFRNPYLALINLLVHPWDSQTQSTLHKWLSCCSLQCRQVCQVIIKMFESLPDKSRTDDHRDNYGNHMPCPCICNIRWPNNLCSIGLYIYLYITLKFSSTNLVASLVAWQAHFLKSLVVFVVGPILFRGLDGGLPCLITKLVQDQSMAQPIMLVHFSPSTLSGGLHGGLLVAKPVNFGLWPLAFTLPLESGGFGCGLSLTLVTVAVSLPAVASMGLTIFGLWKLVRVHLGGLGGGRLGQIKNVVCFRLPDPT